ncbi:MAG: hypothetical protein JSR99_09920 [Proteobacteria bacterium]|nr:hypothetical protein [Pseudomonadota bacterium]
MTAPEAGTAVSGEIEAERRRAQELKDFAEKIVDHVAMQFRSVGTVVQGMGEGKFQFSRPGMSHVYVRLTPLPNGMVQGVSTKNPDRLEELLIVEDAMKFVVRNL